MDDDTAPASIRIDWFQVRGDGAGFEAQIANPSEAPLHGVEVQLLVDGHQVGRQLLDRLDGGAAEWIELAVTHLAVGAHRADLVATASWPATEPASASIEWSNSCS